LLVFERGWLSSNNILFIGKGSAALVDTGYCTHAQQTMELVSAALKGRSLDHIVNTHLHSDHCGGNAALQAAYPAVQTHGVGRGAIELSTYGAKLSTLCASAHARARG
jgi:glyoxylase-like metal-dependent hydrolase (beta-lactamase superfamily II)